MANINQPSNSNRKNSALSNQSSPNAKDKGKEILVMTVNIRDGQKDQIIVHEADNPEDLAYQFARKHSLPKRIENALIHQILHEIEVLIQEEDDKTQEIISQNPSKAASPKKSHNPIFQRIQDKVSSKSNNSPAISSSFISAARQKSANYGEYLYTKELQHKEQKELLNQKWIEMKQEAEGKELTFKPTINTSLASTKRSTGKCEESLLSREADRQQKLAQEVERKFIEEKAKCPFSPKLNKMSNKILQQIGRNGVGNIWNDLYEEAKVREAKREEMSVQGFRKTFTFQPEISDVFPHESGTGVVERLLSAKQERDNKIEHQRSINNLPIDQNTGQELFKPAIGRPPASDRNRKEVPVGEYLYKLKKKPVKPLDFPHQPVDMEGKKRTSRVVEKMKIERYFEIFQMLSPDMQGCISFENINRNKVDPKILKVIKPLLEELEGYGQPLNFQEVCDALDNLSKTLTPLDKSVITLKKREEKIIESEPLSLKKSISHDSLNRTNIYERGMQNKELRAAKLEKERLQFAERQVQGCTFSPKIKEYKPEHSYYY
ncbi:unnamed protein product [Blepharisma stoltei]|uniref:Uncharacterized protein n=1 Tax=Blepharisma stoltei TaxID=1481888 RepID=A0AAU9JM32_9CILI|nr:unnamed protein product [Blepharisma stoltei]